MLPLLLMSEDASEPLSIFAEFDATELYVRTLQAMSTGIQFSGPTFRSGYSVVVPTVQRQAVDMWSFGKAFEVQLCMALIGTCFFLGLLVYFMEMDYVRRGLGKSKYSKNLKLGEHVKVVYLCTIAYYRSTSFSSSIGIQELLLPILPTVIRP